MRTSLTARRIAALLVSLLGIVLTAGQCGGSADSPPVLSAIADQRTLIGETIDIPFTITDENPASVTVDGTSDDQTLVADVDIEVLGSGADRTLRITPAPLGTGSVIITLTAQDQTGFEGTREFRLNVTLPFQTQFPKLAASDAADWDNFGRSVAIDGDYAIIGAAWDDLAGTNEGSAYAFKRSGDSWEETGKLTASDAADSVTFGWSVAIDGDYAIIGAPGQDINGTTEGSAYAFKRSGDTWVETGKLTASDAAVNDQFGYSVAIHGDYAIIGARFDDDDLTGIAEGSAYAFKRSGDTWVEIDKLTASDAADSDRFGYSVAIDGDYAIIGAYRDDLAGTDEGSAYAFMRSGDTWVEIDKLTASDAADSDRFGYSVAIDGDYAIIGADGDDLAGTDEGSAYAFKRSGDTWVEIYKLTAGDAADSDFFGYSVEIDGDYAIIGAPNDDGGSAYVFKRSTDAWLEIDKLTASDAATGDAFGISVAIGGDFAIIGAGFDDLTGTNEGSAYVLLK